MTIKPIETTYNGVRFRSRLEARWAVFCDVAGLPYDYEPSGFKLSSGPYLPDFWLRDIRMFLEIKPDTPSSAESTKCAELAERTEADCLIAIGAPQERFQLLWFGPTGQREGLFVFARDRFAGCGFWLVSEEDAVHIGPYDATGRRGGPMLDPLQDAFDTARSARFGAATRSRPYPAGDDADPGMLG